MKMWSGRFRQPLDPDFERWQRSFEFDRRLLREELSASLAHANALKNAGVLSSSELITILQGLKQIGETAAAAGTSKLRRTFVYTSEPPLIRCERIWRSGWA